MESDELKTEYNRLYDEFKKIEYGETDHRYRKSLKSIVEQKINENDQIAAEIFESSLKSLIALIIILKKRRV
jgi:N-acetylglucosamine kinase-like BadF-type ATPase